jgi:hypothetical protein
MNRRAAAIALLLVVAAPLRADFSSIARALDSQQGMKRISIPFLGLARMFVWMAKPEGVYDFQLATYEGGGTADPKALHEIIRRNAGKGFVPLVQTWSRRSNDYSFIYVRPSTNASRMELMILAHDGSETVLVRVDVDASIVAKELREQPAGVSRSVTQDIASNSRH